MIKLRIVLAGSLVCLVAAGARAEGPKDDRGDSVVEIRLDRGDRHLLYAEAFGKGGLYGLGYEYQWLPRLGFGVAASAYELDSERVLSLSPYLSTVLLGRGRHVWFGHVGARMVERAVESPVEGWDGVRERGIAAQVASGYEYRGPVVLRAAAVLGYGEGGFSPWAGFAIGRRF